MSSKTALASSVADSWASSDTELAHKIAQLAELAQVFERW